jgi:hypothetical protein
VALVARGGNAMKIKVHQKGIHSNEKIVHCKDCVYLMADICARGWMGVVNPNDYCSKGMRRSDRDG